MNREEFYLLTGAYSLDALTPEEAEAFRAAAAESPELAHEADELAATAALLALASTPVEPPASLKQSLMAKIAQTPQESRPSLTPHETRPSAPDALPPAGRDEPVELAPVALAPVAPAAVASAPAAFAGGSAAETKARSRWFTRPTGILVAAAAAVALFVGGGVVGTALTQNASSSSQQASASGLAELYAASDVQTSRTTITGGGEATVMWSDRLGKSAIVAQGLASLPAGKTYEAWYINDKTVTPAGTFTPGGDATTWHVLSGSMTPGDTVGVTVEPAGGSQAPTSTPIFAVASA